MPGLAATEFTVRQRICAEDEGAVSRVEADLDHLPGIGAADTIALVLAADGHLTGVTDEARPTLLSQIGIDPLQVEQGPLVLDGKSDRGLQQLRMRERRWLAGTTGRLRGQVKGQFVEGLVQRALQGGAVTGFVADDGIVADRLVTAFDLGVIGGLARSNGQMADAQAQQPETEGAGKAVSALPTKTPS